MTEIEWVDGRPARIVTRREAEFDEEQVDLLLAVQQIERETGPHGIPMAKATDVAMRPWSKSKEPGGAHFTARRLATDWAQAALDSAKDAFYTSPEAEATRAADIWVVDERPDPVLPTTKRQTRNRRRP